MNLGTEFTSFDDIGQVTYNETDIANLKEISKKVKDHYQEEITPFSGDANSTGLPLSDEDLPRELSQEEKEKLNNDKKFINPENQQIELYDNYHNFYINFFKYLKYFLGTHLTKGLNRNNSLSFIKNFSFNYSSQIMASYNYNNRKSYELPTAKINLVDIRALDNTQFIQRQTMGNNISNQVVLAENDTLDETIFTTLQFNYVNISVEINVESSSELLDYISNVNNHFPLNYTVYAPKFINYFNVSNVTKDWMNNHNYYGITTFANNTYKSKIMTYSGLELSPTVELTNITQSVSKEENVNSITLDFIFGINIPFDVFKKQKHQIKKITTDLNLFNHKILNDLPILNEVSQYVKNNTLQIGSKSNQIINKIQLTFENIIIFDRYKILTFYSDKLYEFIDNQNIQMAYWKKLDNSVENSSINSSEVPEQLIPLNFLKKYHNRIFFIEDLNKTTDENINNFKMFTKKEIEKITTEQNKEILTEFIILRKEFLSTLTNDELKIFIDLFKENKNKEIDLKYKTYQSDRSPRYYIIKSSLIKSEFSNEIENFYNSILIYK